MFSFSDEVDVALLIHHHQKMLLGRNVPLKCLTHSSSLYKIIIRSTTTTERRLMIELQGARESFDRRGVTEISWIERDRNLSDALTKATPCHTMDLFLQTQCLQYETLQWVLHGASSRMAAPNAMNLSDRHLSSPRSQKPLHPSPLTSEKIISASSDVEKTGACEKQ